MIPQLTPITVQVQDPDYRFIELCNLELSGHATGEEIAELEAMCAVKEALPEELKRDGEGVWL